VLLLTLLLGQSLLTHDRGQLTTSAAAKPPPAVRARFAALRRLARPGAASLPVTIEKAPPSLRPAESSREVWIADWRRPGSDSSGFRIVLDGNTGRVLLIGGDLRTGSTVVGDGEGDGSGAVRTREEAARTARRYLVCFGERSTPSAPFTVQRLPSGVAFPSGAWRLSLRCPGSRRAWMLLDAKTGKLLSFWNLALRKDSGGSVHPVPSA
jgi:hypothetical protein